jgi:ATP synthase protein I
MPSQRDPEEPESGRWLSAMMRQAGPYMSAAYTLTGGLLGLGLLGWFVDRWLGTSPAFLLTGLLLGMVVGFYELWKVTFVKPK